MCSPVITPTDSPSQRYDPEWLIRCESVIMTEPTPDKDEKIALLLGKLADLSGEEEELEAYRREAEAFDPAASTAGIERALIALEAARTPP
jgi:hypothetical protein